MERTVGVSMNIHLVEQFTTKQGLISILCVIAVIYLPFFSLQFHISFAILLPIDIIFIMIAIVNSDFLGFRKV